MTETQITQAKASEQDINTLRDYLLKLEEMAQDSWRYLNLEMALRNFPTGWRRVVEGYVVLFDNACDPALNHLAWKPEIARLIGRAELSDEELQDMQKRWNAGKKPGMG